MCPSSSIIWTGETDSAIYLNRCMKVLHCLMRLTTYLRTTKTIQYIPRLSKCTNGGVNVVTPFLTLDAKASNVSNILADFDSCFFHVNVSMKLI